MARSPARPAGPASSHADSGMASRQPHPVATTGISNHTAHAAIPTAVPTAVLVSSQTAPHLAVPDSTPSVAPRGSVRQDSNAFNPDADIFNLGFLDVAQLQAESSSSDSEYRSKRHAPKHTGHSRSMSNPFPSLFSARKKKKKDHSSSHDRSADFDDSDSSDDIEEPAFPRQAAGANGLDKDRSGRRAVPGVPRSRQEGFVTGLCITCGSQMRWVNGVDAFRCSICLTVNDLDLDSGHIDTAGSPAPGVPAGSTSSATGQASGGHTAKKPSAVPAASGPLSVEKTKKIVRDCLRAYLKAVLSNVDPNAVMASSDVLPVRLKNSPPEQSSSQESPRRNVPEAPSRQPPRPPDISNIGIAITSDTGGAMTPAETSLTASSGAEWTPPWPSRHGRSASHVSPRPQPLYAPGPGRPRAVSRNTPLPFGEVGQPGQPEVRQPGEAATKPSVATSRPSPEGANYKRIFRLLEDYIVAHIMSIDGLNSSFLPPSTKTTGSPSASIGDGAGASASAATNVGLHPPADTQHSRHARQPSREAANAESGTGARELDPKLLLVGSVAENGLWWTGAQLQTPPASSKHRRLASEGGLPRANGGTPGTPHKSPSSGPGRTIRIDWPAVDEWHDTVINAGAMWEDVYGELVAAGACPTQPPVMLQHIEAEILKAQDHTQRIMLKSVETMLKRPGRCIGGESGDVRFLLVALANPLLYSSPKIFAGRFQSSTAVHASSTFPRQRQKQADSAARGTGPASGQHSGIIKRILGLLSNVSDRWRSHVTSCFSKYSNARFIQTKDLVSGFLAYRLIRHNEKKEIERADMTGGLVPKMPTSGSVASLHAAIGEASVPGSGPGPGTGPGPSPGPGSAKKSAPKMKKLLSHGDDWQIKAAARVLGLLFSANNRVSSHRQDTAASSIRAVSDTAGTSTNISTGPRACLRGQILPTSDFYMTLLDSCDLIADFETWEHTRSKFTFCQYPFLLSVWAKIQILEHEARRQMKSKARDAFFDSIMTRRNFDQHFVLNVRRDCLVEDSLKAVSEAIGSGGGDVKKGLRIVFNGEEGIDAGGLRKEWFLLLVREVFNPDHGMFTYDEESQYCYFNPSSFETSDQFFLVGVVLGLAIYNSTILDIALPPFAFRKLLLAAPAAAVGLSSSLHRSSMTYTLADLAEYRPSLAKGLQQLLDYEGDVESTFGLDFTMAVDRYGATEGVPLGSGGANRAVTNSNRREYVDLYVRYLLEVSVSRQFEPFKRGFFTVCGCNALGLFRPEEIELLVRGSDEPLDIPSLRLAATYDNWGSKNPLEKEATLQWFWQIFEEVSPEDQRKLLIFITGSDRIPATGAASLSIRILCLGEDTGRFPTARTCFNTLTLCRYESKEKLRERLWGAVNESEGFGLK